MKNPEKRLNRFYGDVAKEQNADIIKLISGKTILDIGCGYGNLINQIKTENKQATVTGIDTDQDSILLAKKLYDINVKPISVYDMDFPEKHFDTVILREAIHHIKDDGMLERALDGIAKICKKEIVIFDPNPNWIVKVSRKLIKHKDPEARSEDVMKALKKAGFEVKTCKWRDVIAFPLSGGFVGKELVPNIRVIKRLVLSTDKFANHILSKLRIQRHVCWRYVIHATLEQRNR